MIETVITNIIAFPSNVNFHGFLNRLWTRWGGGGEPRHSVNGPLGFLYILVRKRKQHRFQMG